MNTKKPALRSIPTGPATTGADRTISICLTILTALALIGVLIYFSDFLTPIATTLVLCSVLLPAVEFLERYKISPYVSATIIVAALTALLIVGAASLSDPFHDWLDTLPAIISGALEKLRVAAEPVRAALGQKSTRGALPVADIAPAAAAVNVVGGTAKILGRFTEAVLLMLLALGGGRRYLKKVVNIVDDPTSRAKFERTIKEAHRIVFRYLTVALFINLGQGVIVAAIMWQLGLPAPMFWGLATVVLEFIPYLGAAVMIVMLVLTGLTTLNSLAAAAIAPAAYFAVATIQNNLISPIAYSRRLNLNPPAILIGVAFWYTIWGVPGAFLAVPILAVARVAASNSVSWRWFGQLLAE